MNFVQRFHKWHGTKPLTTSPPAQGTCAGRSIVIAAGARCVWDDLLLFGVDPFQGKEGWDIMTVNDIVCYLPCEIAHHYSNANRLITHHLGVRRLRMPKGPEFTGQTHTCRTGAQNNWPWPGHGTSSLGATYAALAMGYERIVLCGVPLDNSGHFFDPPNGRYTFSRFEQEVGDVYGGVQYWTAVSPLFEDKVRSMSGRTKELLGAPDGWIE